ncbi:MAG: HAD hydrolase-like protein [Hyphomicrobiales bacterium]|nr:HAD hydrolase-like protein [Hyphomicrobiales bacterium]
MLNATKFDAVSFDVYGTILNWEPEIAAFLSDWASSCGLTIEITKLLSVYDHIRQPLQDERPALRYPEVLKRTLRRMATEFSVNVTSRTLERFSGIAATHKPFGDSVEALSDMRSMGLKLAALSNVDEQSFGSAMLAAGIKFDVVVTAQRVGAYKPDHAHFWAGLSDLRALGIPMDRVLHVAQSKRADIVVANAIGLKSIWVNRPGHIFGRTGYGAEKAKPDFEAESLATVAQMLSCMSSDEI